MSPGRWKTLEDLFHQTCDRPAEERTTWAREACGNDTELWDELRRMLAADALTKDPADEAVRRTASAWIGPDGAPATHAGPWLLQRPLGAGGMGAVYLASRDDGHFEQLAAVKFLRADFAIPGAAARFRAERQMLAGLEHPNIARLIDGGETSGGQLYLAMEFVDGAPLCEYATSLATAERCRIFLKVCDAVAYAHRNLIVHRDIKPANILVTAGGVPKLLDFGIAKFITHEVPGQTFNTGFFTPEYASPEQVAGVPVTTAADVYSLGVVLFELLTGRRARNFKNAALVQMVDAIRSDPAPKAGLDSDIDNILQKAMAADPVRRYGSAEQFAADIERYLDGKPVLARGDSFGYIARKFVWRHKLALAAGVAFVAAIAASAIYSFEQARRAEQQRQIAAAEAQRASIAATDAARHREDAVQQAAEARRERDLSQQRLDQLRKLTEQFLFEFHDSIQTLPGATKARQLVVSTAREHLQRMEKESKDDPRIVADLARAYQKVADVEGNPAMEHLGDIPGAIASYQKAISLWRRLPDHNAEWRRQLMSMQAGLAVAASDTGKAAMAESLVTEALANFRSNTDRDLGFRRAAANTHLDRAQIRSGLGKFELALADTESAVRLLDGDPEIYGRQRALTRQSSTLTRLRRFDEAYATALQALELAAQLTQANPLDVRHKVRLMQAEISAGFPHTIRTNPKRNLYLALQHYERALPLAESIAAGDINNVRATRDVSGLLTRIGDVYLGLADFSKAISAYQRANTIAERLLKNDPDSIDFLEASALALDRLAATQNSLKRYADALPNAKRSLALYQRIGAISPKKLQAETVPSVHTRLGDCYDGLGDRPAAIEEYERSLEAAAVAEKVHGRPLTELRAFATRRLAALRVEAK
jgi:tetratricopeptide (TPR) repeat protein